MHVDHRGSFLSCGDRWFQLRIFCICWSDPRRRIRFYLCRFWGYKKSSDPQTHGLDSPVVIAVFDFVWRESESSWDNLRYSPPASLWGWGSWQWRYFADRSCHHPSISIFFVKPKFSVCPFRQNSRGSWKYTEEKVWISEGHRVGPGGEQARPNQRRSQWAVEQLHPPGRAPNAFVAFSFQRTELP